MNGRLVDRARFTRFVIGWCIPLLVTSGTLCIVMGGYWSGPFGIHFIRQTDSLAFVVHFREFTSNLLHPGVMDLTNAPDHGAAAGEFPVIYWILAMLERFFGLMPDALRWVNLVLVVLSQVVFLRALRRMFDGWLAAYATVLMLSSSSVLAFYAFNYLPDAGVYALVMMGWSLMMPDLMANQPRPRWIPLLLFTLAGAIKAPAMMHLLAWGLLMTAQRVRTRAPFQWGRLLAFLSSVGLVSAWHLYARFYNAAHDSHYFLTWAEPIWEMSAGARQDTWRLMSEYWWTKYMHPSVWHLLGVLLMILLIRWQRLALAEKLIIVLLCGSAASFIVLFFRKFADHDYYFLTLLPAVSWTTVFGCKVLLEWLRSRPMRMVASVAVGAVAIAGQLLARNEMQRRTTGPARDHARAAPYLKDIQEKVSALNLPIDARVIVLGDSSANGALNAVARLGWAFPGYPAKPEPALDQLVALGATHLLVIDQVTTMHVGQRRLTGSDKWMLWEIIR